MGEVRKSTRSKYNGRSNIVQALRCAYQTLTGNIKNNQAALEKVNAALKELDDAEQQIIIHKLPQKRILTAIKREQKHLKELAEKVTVVPITQGEKLIAKRKRGGAK